MVKSRIALAAALALAALAAQAQDGRGLRPLMGVGLSFGGDTLATVSFSNAPDEKISSGGLAQLFGGAEFRLSPQFSLQGTLGYHVHDTSAASNGGLRFSRWPVELLGLFDLNGRLRLGLGAQHVASARLQGSGVLGNLSQSYAASTGLVVEGEYLVTPQVGIKLRGVTQKYRPEGGGAEIDGSHVGLMLGYYF